jgi:hypothetical protein
MAIVLKKPAGNPPAAAAKPQAAAKAPSAAAPAKAGGLSFLKKGAAAKATFEQEEMKSEMAAKNTARRFFLKMDKPDASITFLDGNISEGAFENPAAFEHFIMLAGKPMNYICLHEEESCPICEGGNKYSYVSYFSIIDHREYKGNDGKTYKDQRRLFVAKRGTLKQLLKAAQKRGGLAGWRCDVSRTGDKEASVGNVFDFSEKMTPAQLKATYGENGVPFDYDQVISEVFVASKDLRKLGFGQTGVGNESAPSDNEDHSDKL